jgi:hypothetical protein
MGKWDVLYLTLSLRLFEGSSDDMHRIVKKMLYQPILDLRTTRTRAEDFLDLGSVSRLTDGGKVVSLTHRPHFTPQKHYYFYVSGTHFR